MQRIIKKTWVLLIAAGFLFPNALSGQNNAPTQQTRPTRGTVVRGERPVPDYSKVSSHNIVPGIIRIKFSESFSDLLQTVKTGTDTSSLLPFGINAVDELNRQLGITGVRPSFFIALRNTLHTVRHREWGLHLWYDLTMSPELDILEVVNAMQPFRSWKPRRFW